MENKLIIGSSNLTQHALSTNLEINVEISAHEQSKIVKEIKKFCRDKIADFKQPKKIIIINELNSLNEIPKGPTKKVLYRKLKEYYKKFF